MEIWKDIKGYEGEYQVSNLGQVKSLKRGLIMRLHVMENGYINVSLWKEGKEKKHLVHRLVAEAFCPNPMYLNEINHRDENKRNNSWINLEFCTHRYNCNYGTAIERAKQTRAKNKRHED